MTDPSLNERLAAALGWRKDEASPGNWIPPGCRQPSKGIYYTAKPPDYASSYPGMGAVLEAMRERPVSTRREFARLLSVAAITRTPRDGGGPLWILEIFDPELIALAAVEALEGEADAKTHER